MTLFHDPRDEEKLCQVLRAFVEEWGAESVVVSLPRDWKYLGATCVGRVRLEFNTGNTIAINVRSDAAQIRYAVNLRIS